MRINIWIMVLFVGCTAASFSPVAMGEGSAGVLTIGSPFPTIPYKQLDELQIPCHLVPQNEVRSEAFPFMYPLATTVNNLPDIVCALIGFRGGDIDDLVDNNCIVALDEFFASRNLNPQEILPENILKAVTYKGKIWALPHEIQSYFLSYDKELFLQLGLKENLQTWSDVLKAAQAICEQANANALTPGFTEGNIGFENSTVIVLDMLENGPAAACQEFLQTCISEQVLSGQESLKEKAIRIETLSTLLSSKDKGLVPWPASFNVNEPQRPTPGMLQAYCIRKNTPEKIALAEKFLEWLLNENTQMRLTSLSSITQPLFSISLNRHHFPLYSTIYNSQPFKELLTNCPDYQVVLSSIPKITFGQPGQDEPSEEKKEFYYELLTMTTETMTIEKTVISAVQLLQKGEFDAGQASHALPSGNTDVGSYDEY